MIRALEVLCTCSTDPWHNLALEEYLLYRVPPDTCLLYLWQNSRTVVLGRNQNADNECRIPLLLQEGGRPARRLSGGGAVYHDLGNLNFTFLLPTADFDAARQTAVLTSALQEFGIEAEKSGRNDLTVDGRKFSGHAYYHAGGRSYHHGTLMVRVDLDRLTRYLHVSPLKLQAKGVASVRARVGNLSDRNPAITTDGLRQALIAAFGQVYGLPVRMLDEAETDDAQLAHLLQKYASPAWIYKESLPAQFSQEARFSWGIVRVDWSLSGGRLTGLALWSDGLEADFLERIPALLEGMAPQTAGAVLTAAGGPPDVAADVAGLLRAADGTPYRENPAAEQSPAEHRETEGGSR